MSEPETVRIQAEECRWPVHELMDRPSSTGHMLRVPAETAVRWHEAFENFDAAQKEIDQALQEQVYHKP